MPLKTLRPRVATQRSRLTGKTATTERVSGRKLQAIRARHFRADPLCVRCRAKGITRVWTQLDHVTALINGRDDGPRQGLCDECHRLQTEEDMRIYRGGGL